jgi:hypothetical protein
MGLPLTIQPADDVKIRALKKRLGADTKIQVVRAGLALLEKEADRNERVARWQRAAQLVRVSSAETNREFLTARAGKPARARSR